jgi:hypothetical protein
MVNIVEKTFFRACGDEIEQEKGRQELCIEWPGFTTVHCINSSAYGEGRMLASGHEQTRIIGGRAMGIDRAVDSAMRRRSRWTHPVWGLGCTEWVLRLFAHRRGQVYPSGFFIG